MVLQVFLWVNIHPFLARARAPARTRMIGIALRNGVDLPQHPHVCAS
jgi:hypothetical protein